jgi:hypothetical protein
MIKLSNLIACTLLCPLLVACIADPSGRGMNATGLSESRGLGLVPGYSVKRKAADLWQVDVSANEYTSPHRMMQISKVRAAQLALENGYTHIKFKGEMAGSCSFQNGTYISVAPYYKGKSQASRQAAPGFESAQAVLDEHLASVTREPSPQERAAAYAELRRGCGVTW